MPAPQGRHPGYLNYYPIAQAKAWLSGHAQVESQDLLALKNYLWQKPGDRAVVEAALNRICVNPMQDKVNSVRAMALDIQTEFEARQPTKAGATPAARPSSS